MKVTHDETESVIKLEVKRKHGYEGLRTFTLALNPGAGKKDLWVASSKIHKLYKKCT